MRRRKLQKKCNSENATLEVAFFRILRCICFGAVAFLFAFFSFFFRKKNTKVDQSCKKNATEKMQRRKLQKKCNGENATLEVAFFLHFPFRYFWHLHFPLHCQIFRICYNQPCGFAWSSHGSVCCLQKAAQRLVLVPKTHRSGTAWLTACLPFFWAISKLETSNLTKLLHFGVVFFLYFSPPAR